MDSLVKAIKAVFGETAVCHENHYKGHSSLSILVETGENELHEVFSCNTEGLRANYHCALIDHSNPDKKNKFFVTDRLDLALPYWLHTFRENKEVETFFTGEMHTKYNYGECAMCTDRNLHVILDYIKRKMPLASIPMESRLRLIDNLVDNQEWSFEKIGKILPKINEVLESLFVPQWNNDKTSIKSLWLCGHNEGILQVDESKGMTEKNRFIADKFSIIYSDGTCKEINYPNNHGHITFVGGGKCLDLPENAIVLLYYYGRIRKKYKIAKIDEYYNTIYNI